MVPLPQSLFSTEFLGTPVPTHAPSRAPNPANPKLSVPGGTFGATGACSGHVSEQRTERPIAAAQPLLVMRSTHQRLRRIDRPVQLSRLSVLLRWCVLWNLYRQTN